MAGGFHNGFNPFRDAHGRWATPGGHAADIHGAPEGAANKGGGAMNDALRSASGRATGGGGGGGSGGSGGGAAPFSAAAVKGIIAQPTVQQATFSAGINAKLDAASGLKGGWETGLQASHEGLNGAAFSILSDARGATPQAKVDTLIQAYKEAGFDPPAASKGDMLALMDHFEGVEFGGKSEANLTAYSIAASLKGGDQWAALNFADGRAGAGIGWDLQREELGGKPRGHDQAEADNAAAAAKAPAAPKQDAGMSARERELSVVSTVENLPRVAKAVVTVPQKTAFNTVFANQTRAGVTAVDRVIASAKPAETLGVVLKGKLAEGAPGAAAAHTNVQTMLATMGYSGQGKPSLPNFRDRLGDAQALNQHNESSQKLRLDLAADAYKVGKADMVVAILTTPIEDWGNVIDMV
jgi:hypothetical protein